MRISSLWQQMSLERLVAAKALFDGGHYRDSISRSYYAAYCAATSELTNRSASFAPGWRNPSHDELPNLILNAGTLLSAKRRLITKSLRLLRRAREDADDRPGTTIDRATALNCLHNAIGVLEHLELKNDAGSGQKLPGERMMADFTVPLRPGWGKRFSAQHGSYDGDVLAVSPQMCDTIDALRHDTYLTLPEQADFVSVELDMDNSTKAIAQGEETDAKVCA